jgi:hypothetical protein
MTYRDLSYKATRLCDKGEITLGEYEEMTKPLDREVEQEPILDKLKAEIKAKIEEEEFARSVFRHEEKDTAKAEQCTGGIMAYNNVIKLIDKYKAESEDKE